MTIYNFVKNVNLTKLTGELNSSSLSTYIESIQVNDNLINIECSRDLSKKEYLTLHSIISKHSDMEDQIKQKVLAAIVFGQSIIIEVGVENIMLGFTTSQITMMLVKFAGLKGMLETGSLYTALLYIETIKPDDIMQQWRIDKYKNKIKIYLGVK